MLTETFILENGWRIGHQEKEHITLHVEPSMRASGKRINNMVMERNIGPMKRSIRENTGLEKNMERDFSFGKMTAHMRESSVRTTSMASEDTSGRMGGFMKENGRITKWMEEESSLGSTAAGIKESTAMTKKKALVCLLSEMDVFTKESGPMVSNMAKASSARKTLRGRGCGNKVSGSSGLTRPSKTNPPRTKSATPKTLPNDQHIFMFISGLILSRLIIHFEGLLAKPENSGMFSI